MTDSPILCPGCSSVVDAQQTFCSTCGLKLQSLESSADIDAYVRGRVTQELDNRLAGEDRIATSVAAAAEDKLWRSLTRFGTLLAVFIGALIAVVGYFGVKSFNDTVGGVVKSVTSAVKEVQTERTTIETTAEKSSALKEQLAGLSTNVQTQAEEVQKSGAEIKRRLSALEQDEGSAETNLKSELARAKDLGDELAVTDRTLQTTAARVSQQQDDIGIRQAYPGLGQPTYITYGGLPWKGASNKKPAQKWLSLDISSNSLGQLSIKTVAGLVETLKAADVVTFPANFGTGGSVPSLFFSFEILGSAKTTLIYFRPADAASAASLAGTCAKALGFPVATYFSDPASWIKGLYGPQRRLVASDSGLDFQLLIEDIPDDANAQH